MRSLIRPALFMVARLGLLFSVIACVYGQTWQGSAYSYKMVGAIDRAGVGIAIVSISAGASGILEALDDHIIIDFFIGKGLQPSDTHFSLGVVAISLGKFGHAIGTYHWFTITAFTMFNVVLMSIYRKQRKGLGDE